MRHLIPVATLIACLVHPALAAPDAPVAPAPTHKAFDVPEASLPSCFTQNRLLSRAAYVPAESRMTHCGHLLSTDTLITVHRWDHT